MSWNHRVLLTHVQLGPEEFDHYAVHEVYYDDNGVPTSWTKEPIAIVGDDYVECRNAWEMIARAFTLPVLEVCSGEKLHEIEVETQS